MPEVAEFAILVFREGSVIGQLIAFAPDFGACLDRGAALVAADPALVSWACPGVAPK